MLVQEKETDTTPIARLLQEFAATQPDELLFMPERRLQLQNRLRPHPGNTRYTDELHEQRSSGES